MQSSLANRVSTFEHSLAYIREKRRELSCMVMQNEGRYETEIVDTKETLPFVLKLIIGTETKGEYILLNRLCTSTTALVQCIYKVQELKPIRLQYHYENPMNITFIWNKVYEGQKNIKETKYEINEKTKGINI